jgi:hypothetical protein
MRALLTGVPPAGTSARTTCTFTRCRRTCRPRSSARRRSVGRPAGLSPKSAHAIATLAACAAHAAMRRPPSPAPLLRGTRAASAPQSQRSGCGSATPRMRQWLRGGGPPCHSARRGNGGRSAQAVGGHFNPLNVNPIDCKAGLYALCEVGQGGPTAAANPVNPTAPFIRAPFIRAPSPAEPTGFQSDRPRVVAL